MTKFRPVICSSVFDRRCFELATERFQVKQQLVVIAENVPCPLKNKSLLINQSFNVLMFRVSAMIFAVNDLE